jgi:hypothetical protein
MTGMAGPMRVSLAVRLLGCIQTSQLVPNILIAPVTHTGTRGPDRGRAEHAVGWKVGDHT